MDNPAPARDEKFSGEMGEYAQQLLVTYPLREPVLRSAIASLGLPPASRGLDVGCGIGLQTMLLAAAIGPAGHVSGIDVCPEFAAYARRAAECSGLHDRTSFQAADMNDLPFEDGAFDWAWSVDCVGYHPSDPLPPLRELQRVVKRGGTVAILGWSQQMLLPGYPLLEARLNATSAGYAPFRRGMKAERHFLRALHWFSALGFSDPRAETLAGTAHAPLNEEMRVALLAMLRMRWNNDSGEITQSDWDEFLALCNPTSPRFVLDLPDYYATFVYSMFFARVAG